MEEEEEEEEREERERRRAAVAAEWQFSFLICPSQLFFLTFSD